MPTDGSAAKKPCRVFSTLEENCAENVPGKFGIGSQLLLQGQLLAITHFGEPFVKDGQRFIKFYLSPATPETIEQRRNA